MIEVGVIGFGVVGKRRIDFILKQKNLKLKYISDIKFKKNFSKKKIFFFKNYLDIIKKKPKAVFITLPNYLAAKVTRLCLSKKFMCFAKNHLAEMLWILNLL